MERKKGCPCKKRRCNAISTGAGRKGGRARDCRGGRKLFPVTIRRDRMGTLGTTQDVFVQLNINHIYQNWL